MNFDNGLPGAVILDLGDTVFHSTRYDRVAGINALLKHARGAKGVTAAQLAERGVELDRRLESSCAAENLEYRQTDFHRLLYGSFGITLDLPDEEAERRYWDSCLSMELEPGVERALQAIEGRGVRMAVISNAVYSGATLGRELERLGVGRHFEFIISSADYGVRKPDPLLFDVARERLGIPASDCLYIGNLISVDVAGSASAGWRSGWYAAQSIREGTYGEELRELDGSVSVWRSWREFAEEVDQ